MVDMRRASSTKDSPVERSSVSNRADGVRRASASFAVWAASAVA